MNRFNKSHPGDCIPISSNCVKWDGGKICCIDVCPDDTVTSVTKKLGEYICHLVSLLDLSELDYKCLVGENDDVPVKLLINVLQLMIDKQCELEEAISLLADRVTELENQQTDINNPVFDLPDGYQYTVEGDLITQLPQDEVITLILERTGDSFGDIEVLQGLVEAQGEAIAVLEGQIESPTPIPELIIPEIMGDEDPHQVQDVVTELADQYVDTVTNLGTIQEMVDTITTQPSNLDGLPALSIPANMEDLYGWVSPVSNLAESVKNLWITLLDMRAALVNLIPAPTSGCPGINFDFGTYLNGTQEQLIIYVFGYSTIPSGFVDCDAQGADVTIEDELGNTFSTKLLIYQQISNPSGFFIDISNTPLNTKLNMTVTVDYCLTNNVDTCSDTVTKASVNTVSKCPTINTTPTAGLLTVSVTPQINNNVTYLLKLYKNNVLISQQTFMNPSGPFVAQWTSLASGTDYELRTTVQITDLADVTCPVIPITIPSQNQ